jgi:cell division protein FtsW
MAAPLPAAERFTEPAELRRSAFLLLSCVLVLLAFGIVMVWSAAAIESAEGRPGSGSPLKPLFVHGVKVAVGLALMACAARLDLRRLARLATPFYVGSLVLLALVLVPGIGHESHGSRRWFPPALLGGFAFQPSELAKLALIVHLAARVARVEDFGASFRRSFLPAAFAVLLPGALILLETDFGTFVLLTVLGFLLLLIGGASVLQLGLLALLTVPPALGFLALSPRTSYVFDRLLAFVGRAPETAAVAGGGLQQIDFAESALRVGGLTGVGLGAGRHKLFFLAESDNDFILSVIGEELGFVGTTAVLLLFALLLWSGRRILLGVRHRFGFLIVAGVLVTIAMQALMNLFVAVRLAPVKGIPLPFVSSGGSSLAVLCLGVGLVLAVARQADADAPELSPEPKP